jgi:GT2 family glycosyltransferase
MVVTEPFLTRNDKRMELSIIIVSWNVEKLLVQCLRSIFDNSNGLAIEVIVVDNNSLDKTVVCVHEIYPQVLIIQNKRNRRFAAATNQGIKASHGRYILLLNPDTVIEDDALNKMITFADSHPEVGVVGPQLQNPTGEIQKYCARSFPRPFDWFWHSLFLGRIFPNSRRFGRLFMSDWDHLDSRPVDAIAGAAMLLSRDTLNAVGLLDETLPAYYEDLEYCYRNKILGKSTYYLADAKVVHYGGQSSAQMPRETTILILEAFRLFFLRYGQRADITLFRLLVILASVIRIYAFAIIKCYLAIFGSNTSSLRRLSLRGEYITILWGLNLISDSSRTAGRS